METWWDKNLPARLEDFKAWTGGPDAPSRVAARKYIIGKGYRRVLDCGCGLGVDYHAYQKEYPSLRWNGIDSCCLPNELTNNGIIARGCDITTGIPYEGASFDVAYSRHVLEHLPTYETALAEMVRVARREVMVVWFLTPRVGTENLTYDPQENLYHNRYELTRLVAYLKSLPRVSDVTWESVNEQECIMHVLLTDSAQGAR